MFFYAYTVCLFMSLMYSRTVIVSRALTDCHLVSIVCTGRLFVIIHSVIVNSQKCFITYAISTMFYGIFVNKLLCLLKVKVRGRRTS